MAKTSASPFNLAERAIISLYDGGVLSPAVLERLLAAFSQANPDWETEPTERSVDGRSLHEVVALTMLPGESPRAARKSFTSVIEHIAGTAKAKKSARKPTKEEDEEPSAEDDDSAELAEQLSGRTGSMSTTRGASGGGKSKTKADETSTKPPAKTAAFNPLMNAAAPRKGRS
ncbi:hypothetical protein [Paraburkholderia rhynchosiae]|uniref:Uncharacterized protein n=1 Tax=Paraburkholderia rhynchosiae TaxID=487049 RepID=A0A2N7WSN8_9BURK|nr:hypothetical protein [Paraburkholderia rhynchosiae]PMS32394.1 hypothetical protein C0Z16_07270 [Paraburkholderia rhynchosiae]CAB3676315.1 hypothetical protein LMG27174_02408 [Paraburkholderia rhynchosiae]